MDRVRCGRDKSVGGPGRGAGTLVAITSGLAMRPEVKRRLSWDFFILFAEHEVFWERASCSLTSKVSMLGG